MKVLFLQDVRPTARAGDIKEVKNGFARNYLIPQKLAVLATQHEIDRAEKLRKEAAERRRVEAAEWRDLVETLKSEPIKIVVRTGPTGRLYGSVTAAMIAEEIQNMVSREVDRRAVRIPSPIRTLGKYGIPVQFADGVDSTLDVLVEPDEDSQIRIEQAKRAREEAATADPTFEEALEQESGEDDGASEGETESEAAGGEAEESTDATEDEKPAE